MSYFDYDDEYMDELDFPAEEADYDTCLEGLLGFLAAIPQETVKLLDLPRYRLVLETAAKLRALLADTEEGGQIDVEVDQMFNLGSVKVELDLLTVLDPKAFAELVAPADNFEVYALTDGRVRLSITFQNVLKSIA